MDFTQLDALKARLDALRPLPPAALRNLHEDLVVRWTYHSNAIEGNTLTLLETRVVLEGITVGGRLLREHFEALNHRDAIEFVEVVVREQEPLSERLVREVHRLVLRNIDDEHAGRYRPLNVTIAGAAHTPPDFAQVPGAMADFVRWHATHAATLHPVERAARVHSEFVKIHPFVDGNGRTSRLLMNLELMQAGFPPAVLPVERRLAYYDALDRAHTSGDFEPFLALVAEFAAKAFDPYWHALGLTP